MRTSSTRLRLGAGLALTTLGLFSLGGSALAGEKAASPSEAKAEQFEDDQERYVEGESRHPSGKDRTDQRGDSGTQGKSTSDPDGDTNGGADKPGGEGGLSTEDQDGNNGCGNDQDFEDDNNGWCGSKPKPVKASSGSEMPPAVEGDKTVKGEKKGDKGTRCPKSSTMPEGDSDMQHCVTGDAGDTVTVDTIDTEDAVGAQTVASGAVLATELQETGAIEGVETRVLGVTIERGSPADTTTAAAHAAGGTGTSVLGASFNRGAALARTGFGTAALVVLGLSLLVIGLLMSRTRKGEQLA